MTMVHYEDADVIPLKEFNFAWRITDAHWSLLPEPVLDRIKALYVARSRQLYAVSPLSRPMRHPPDLGQLTITHQQSLEESGGPDDLECNRWFRQLPIDPTQ